MANSVIKVYAGNSEWKLYPNKLFIVEDIESYLTNFTPMYNILDAQYIKCELEIGVNLAIPQLYHESITASPIYVSIKNSDSTKTYYYFVKERIWRSKECVRLELVMDVLNTFKENTDYTFKENCNIQREHKDRFIPNEENAFRFEFINDNLDGPILQGNYLELRNQDDNTFIAYIQIENYVSGMIFDANLILGDKEDLVDNTNVKVLMSEDGTVTPYAYGTATLYGINFEKYLFRNIDYIPENINPILQCDNAEGQKIEKPSPLNIDWYLLYRNQNDPSDSLVNPVECYLIPSEDLQTNASSIIAGRLNATSLQETYYYYLPLYQSGGWVSVTLDNGTTLSQQSSYALHYVILKKNSNNTITVTFFYENSSQQSIFGGSWTCNYITLNNMPFDYGKTTTAIPDNVFAIHSLYITLPVETFTNTVTPNIIDSVKAVDKTDAKNIKLIKVPYCPYDFTITNGEIDITDDSNWDYVSVEQGSGNYFFALKLNDMNLKLNTTWQPTGIQPFKELYFDKFTDVNPSVTDLRKDMLDSKMYNSEFYQPTFYYDSFTFKMQLEKCDPNYFNTVAKTLQNYISFNVTSTINSKFMFSYETYKLRIANENYAKYMPIAVNNEEVLYNVPYINYIRMGYNYDVKNKNWSNAQTWAGVGASAVGLGVSLLLPSAPLKIAGIISSVIGMGVSIFSAIKTTQANERSLEQKLLQERNQSSTVVGSDDVDLRTVYTENRLKYLVYKPTPVMEALINDLFYYTGYASTEMKKPTHNNRLNFDFLQMNPSFTNEGGISRECLTELQNCFITGVTYIHKVNRRSGKAQWDMDQVLENWETILGV